MRSASSVSFEPIARVSVSWGGKYTSNRLKNDSFSPFAWDYCVVQSRNCFVEVWRTVALPQQRVGLEKRKSDGSVRGELRNPTGPHPPPSLTWFLCSFSFGPSLVPVSAWSRCNPPSPNMVPVLSPLVLVWFRSRHGLGATPGSRRRGEGARGDQNRVIRNDGYGDGFRVNFPS